MGKPLQAPGRDLAIHLDHELLFDQVAVLAQAPPDAAILGQHHQATGLGIEWHQRRQPVEMPLQQAHAGRILAPAAAGRDQGRGGIGTTDGVMARRLVQQDRGRLHGRQERGGIEHHRLVGHRARGVFDHLAIDRDPATLDVLLGFGARALRLFDQAPGESYGLGHGGCGVGGPVYAVVSAPPGRR